MTTYALIHGAGDVGWYWHLVAAELRTRGHEIVAPDLPIDDEAATFGDRAGDDLVVVGQSFGGYTAPIVCDRLPAKHLVLVAAMVPQPGESAHEMFDVTRYAPEPQEDSSTLAIFYHDVPDALAREAISRERHQAEAVGREPWPLAAWPEVPVTAVIGRHDRIFPANWLRKVIGDRLGMTPVELDCGHCVALAQPRELAKLLHEVATR